MLYLETEFLGLVSCKGVYKPPIQRPGKGILILCFFDGGGVKRKVTSEIAQARLGYVLCARNYTKYVIYVTPERASNTLASLKAAGVCQTSRFQEVFPQTAVCVCKGPGV